MRKIPALFCLVLVGTMMRMNAQQMTVWPGDANESHQCNHVDVLSLGLNYGLTGPARNTTDITWQPNQATPWPGAPMLINAVHSDCNGDGTVDRTDFDAITQNFGLVWGGFFMADDSSTGPANFPQLRINLVQDTIYVQGATTLTFSIELGSVFQPVDSIYGIALTIDYDPGIVDAVTLGWTGGFLQDSSGSALVFGRVDSMLGKIYLAATATDHQNRMGYGTLGTIGIAMDENIRINGQYNLFLRPSFLVARTTSAQKVTLHAKADTLTVVTGRHEPVAMGVDIFPNPATDVIAVRSQRGNLQSLQLMDIHGRVVASKTHLKSSFVTFDTDRLTPGCYFLEVRTESGVLRRKLIIESY